MTIDQNVLDVLNASTVTDNVLYLPEGQLDRKLYVAVNKCLEAIGGEWNRKIKGHVFDKDPAALLEDMILTGTYIDSKKEFQFFPTPRNVVEQMIELADVQPDHSVLEPSAGTGAIAMVIRERFPENDLTVADINPKFVDTLITEGFKNAICANFLTAFTNDRHSLDYDRIIMNPPFTRLQDVDHITHAFGLLRPGGRLVSVCSESPFFRETAKALAFRSLIEAHGRSIVLPEGSFKPSGTGVKTRLVVLDK